MSKTIWNEQTRSEVFDRLSKVNASAPPLWGKMNAPQMLAHCRLAMQMALGEYKVAPKNGPFRFPPLRHAVIYWMPWPKGAPTAPELASPPHDEWGKEVTALREAMERMAARGTGGAFAEHAAFGHLSGKDWGALTYRHLDHHLKQFGA